MRDVEQMNYLVKYSCDRYQQVPRSARTQSRIVDASTREVPWLSLMEACASISNRASIWISSRVKLIVGLKAPKELPNGSVSSGSSSLSSSLV